MKHYGSETATRTTAIRAAITTTIVIQRRHDFFMPQVIIMDHEIRKTNDLSNLCNKVLTSADIWIFDVRGTFF